MSNNNIKRITKGIGIILISLIVISSLGGVSANWTMFHENIEHTGFIEEAGDFVSNLWIKDIGSVIKSSPAIKDKILYIAGKNGILKAINMEDGSEKWNQNFNGTIIASPIIKGNDLFIGTDEYMYSYNIEEEKVNWKFKVSKPIESTATINEEILYFGADNGKVYALNANDGSKVWEKEIGGKVKSSPAIANDTLYIGSTNGKIVGLRISDGSELWNYVTGDAVTSSPAITDEKVYIGSQDGTLYSLKGSDGSIVWKYELGNKIISSPTLDTRENSLFIGSDNGYITSLDLRDGTLKWEYKTGGPVQSTPALYEDKVVVGSNDGTGYILNKYTGNIEMTYNPGTYLFNAPFSSSSIVYGESLFFAGEDGYVYSLDSQKLDAPTSNFVYYTIAILIILFIVLIAITITIRRKRR
ncbi:MAG: PQQ-binding-like beta-propeller repeat protein [Methanobrevibacter sp.]|jgi:outer membrane protein assembly factor BamB|nr:PQQ-binding-like beta-propeller repeat protein [Methanobrevibacter sp.]